MRDRTLGSSRELPHSPIDLISPLRRVVSSDVERRYHHCRWHFHTTYRDAAESAVSSCRILAFACDKTIDTRVWVRSSERSTKYCNDLDNR